MSRQNVEIVRCSLEAWKSGAVEDALRYLHPEVTLDVTMRPDGKVWHGREGFRRAMVEWVGTWIGWEFEIERYIDVGDDRVVVLWRERGRAKSSGAPMSHQGVTVSTVRDGMIVSTVITVDRQGTLAALGLSD
jgi:ketosteroid isomerase-like protein